jgi:lysophospholipase L1-like esterase
MQKKAIVLVSWLLLTTIVHAQKTVVCLGSSTTWGTGAVPIDSSWVNLMKAYYTHLGLINQVVNLGGYGATTYAAMPSGFKKTDRPDPVEGYNITAAMTYNPDIVIINYPTNDLASGFPISETLFNLRTIYQVVVNAGKTCYITTTQPRNLLGTAFQQLLKVERDSILNAFGLYALNFYNPIVAADSLSINPIYNFDDTHVNNGGHQQLFQAVRNANIIPITPLALSLTTFTAVLLQQKVLLHWTEDGEEERSVSVIQRSADGFSFEELSREDNPAGASTADLSWTDENPLPGKNFYRIKITAQGQTDFYSPVVFITDTYSGWKIGRLYPSPGAQWNVEILSARTTRLLLRVIDASGKQVLTLPLSINPPSQLIPLNLQDLAKGEYFLQVISPQGETKVRAIIKP